MENNYVKVKGYPHLIRDIKTGALLNVNFDAVHQFREQKKIKSQFKQKELQIEARLSSLENNIADIKTMVTEFIKTYK